MSATLTKSTKYTIVRSILDDVPQIDYEEQMRAMLTEARLNVLPAIVRRMWEDATLRGFIDLSYDFTLNVREVPFCDVEVGEETKQEVKKLIVKRREQDAARSELRAKLEASFAPVRTVKQFVERFPEFEKYLPKEAAESRFLPTVANLISDLTAAGWPKAA